MVRDKISFIYLENIKRGYREEYLAKILKYPNTMFSMPMLYANSGFRRGYMKKILKETGRLWDGICQDLYMGVINIAINKEILNIEYPLTIVALSSKSIGHNANKGSLSIDEGNKKVIVFRRRIIL